jgi:hypothetical protein
VKTSVVLATEDQLSEEVAVRLATAAGLAVGERLRKGGNGYLKSRIRSFCEISRHLPVFVLADLDLQACPVKVINSWFRGQHPTPNLVFRIAVTEIESWVLADHRAISCLLGTAPGVIPREPDSLIDPKATLIKLARRAPKSIRDDLVPPTGSIASQGLGYNTRLSSLIRTTWNPDRAATRSPSLRRARAALHGLANRLG